jgi:hypothetical protein
MFRAYLTAIGAHGVRSWFGVSFEWVRDLKCATEISQRETPLWESSKVWDRMFLYRRSLPWLPLVVRRAICSILLKTRPDNRTAWMRWAEARRQQRARPDSFVLLSVENTSDESPKGTAGRGTAAARMATRMV